MANTTVEQLLKGLLVKALPEQAMIRQKFSWSEFWRLFQKNGMLLDEAMGYPALDLDMMFWTEKYALRSNRMVHYTYEDSMCCYEAKSAESSNNQKEAHIHHDNVAYLQLY
uniref:Uncharacterized protein n=1 Tax=Meloidogyne enterolobii TaxID=390850 RepID=A0A6V7U1K8_MELEN|nr:unnamed protein product [Meloidogyne enterolobii]